MGDATIAGFTLSIRPRGSGGQNFVLNTGDWLSGTASTATSYTKAFLTLDTAALSGGGSGSGGGMGRPTHLTVTCASREDRDYFLTVMHKVNSTIYNIGSTSLLNSSPELMNNYQACRFLLNDKYRK